MSQQSWDQLTLVPVNTTVLRYDLWTFRAYNLANHRCRSSLIALNRIYNVAFVGIVGAMIESMDMLVLSYVRQYRLPACLNNGGSCHDDDWENTIMHLAHVWPERTTIRACHVHHMTITDWALLMTLLVALGDCSTCEVYSTIQTITKFKGFA